MPRLPRKTATATPPPEPTEEPTLPMSDPGEGDPWAVDPSSTSNPPAPETDSDGDDAPAPAPEDAETAPEAPPAAKKTAARRPAKKAAKKAVPAPAGGGAADDWFAPLDEQEDWLRILWWGVQGSTKTTCLATAANEAAKRGSKILVVNAEGGLKVKALKSNGVDTSAIRVFPDPRKQEEMSADTLQKLFDRVQSDLLDDPNSWYAVGFDSLTELVDALVVWAQERRVTRLSKTNANIDEFFVDRDDYGVASRFLAKLLRDFRGLPCHLLLTALLRRDVDEDTSSVKYGPAVNPALAQALAGITDIVIRTEQADGSKPVRGLTRSGGRSEVKDRFNILPRIMVEPTYDRILEYFNGENAEDTDAFQEMLPKEQPKPVTRRAKAAGTKEA